MSTIDLNRLNVRKSYFVRLQQSSIKEAILAELNACDVPIYSHYAWFVESEHARSWTFERWYGYLYIREYSGGKRTSENVEKRADEYSANIQTLFRKILREIAAGGLPDKVYVSVTGTESNGCFIDVECLPILYRQVLQAGAKPEEYQIQDAYLTCERLIRQIFEGGLSATLVTEEKKVMPEPTAILLVNDSFTRQITERINDMIEGATAEILISGWVGTYYLDKLQKR